MKYINITFEFFVFLEKRNALDSYLINTKSLEHIRTEDIPLFLSIVSKADQYISGFINNNTPEGNAYWANMDRAWNEYLDGVYDGINPYRNKDVTLPVPRVPVETFKHLQLNNYENRIN